MGIPKFYSYLIKKYRDEINYRRIPIKINTLAVDFNAVLHLISSIVYAYGLTKENNRGRRAYVEKMIRNKKTDVLMEEYLKLLEYYLNTLLAYYKPTDYFIIAVDGSVPSAKLQQQRVRRFEKAGEIGSTFNTHHITPGTLWMQKVDKFLKKWVKNYSIRGKRVKNIIYSSHLVAGEGEHKILDIFRDRISTENPGAYVIHGNDGDLAILTSLLEIENLFIIRSDDRKIYTRLSDRSEIIPEIRIRFHGMADQVVNVDAIKVKIKFELGKSYRSNLLLHDFAIMSFLLGNDFVPHLYAMTDTDNAFEYMFKTYRKMNETSRKHLAKKIGDLYEIDATNMSLYLKILGNMEREMVERLLNDIGTPRIIRGEEVMSVNGIPLNNSSKLLIADLVLKEESGVKKTQWKLNFNEYQLFWLTKNLPRDYDFYRKVLTSADEKFNTLDYEDFVVSEVSQGYYKTILWIYAYYTRGLSAVDTRFFYKWHYPPTIKQLYLASLNTYERGFYGSRNRLLLNPLQQLLTVLPPQSKNIIPDPMARKMISLGEREAELADLTPNKVKLELEGAKADFKPYALVPPINVERVVKSSERFIRLSKTDPLLLIKTVDLEY